MSGTIWKRDQRRQKIEKMLALKYKQRIPNSEAHPTYKGV